MVRENRPDAAHVALELPRSENLFRYDVSVACLGGFIDQAIPLAKRAIVFMERTVLRDFLVAELLEEWTIVLALLETSVRELLAPIH